jgi:hypothetical protein
MKHVTYGDKPLLMDDETADWLLAYARALGATGGSDSVTVRGLDTSGNEVEAAMLLNSSTALVAETTAGSTQAPRNDEVVAYMRERTATLLSPPVVQPEASDPRPAVPPAPDRL